MLMTNSFQEKNLKQEASTLKQDLSTQKVKKNTYLTRQNTMCESGGKPIFKQQNNTYTVKNEM